MCKHKLIITSHMTDYNCSYCGNDTFVAIYHEKDPIEALHGFGNAIQLSYDPSGWEIYCQCCEIPVDSDFTIISDKM